jgi:hypothetical protein
MSKNINQASIPDEIIMDKICFIRGQKIMLGRDLAELYESSIGHLDHSISMYEVLFLTFRYPQNEK